DVDDPRADAELLDEVVLLVVEGRAAEERDGRRLADPPAVRVPLAIRAVARLTEPLGDPIHRPLEGDLLPLRPSGPPVEDPRQAPGVDRVLECARALGAKGALVDRALRVAFDVDDLPVPGVDQRAAPNGAVGADAPRGVDAVEAGTEGAGPLGRRAIVERVCNTAVTGPSRTGHGRAVSRRTWWAR